MTASTVFWTVFAGVAVFVVGQIVVKFFLEPIQEWYKLRGEIGHSLIFYANVYSNTQACDDSVIREANGTFRRLSCELFAKVSTIPLYSLWSFLHLLPTRSNIEKAGGYLIGLSNGCLDKSEYGTDRNDQRRRKLEALLELNTGTTTE